LPFKQLVVFSVNPCFQFINGRNEDKLEISFLDHQIDKPQKDVISQNKDK
jgi:hypothetical protein